MAHTADTADTAVIIPAKNESANIGRVIEDIQANYPLADIIVIDDCSEDDTAEKASQYSNVKVLQAPIALGIGGAVQLGLKFAIKKGYQVFIRMDGDGQHQAKCIAELVGNHKPGILVQGARPHAQFIASSNWIRKAGSLYFYFLFRICTRQKIPDPTSGLMCFGRDIAVLFSGFYPTDFPEIESLILLIRSGNKIVSAPVIMAPRMGGTSSIGLGRGIVYMLSVTIAFINSFLRTNPYGVAHVAK